MVGTFINYPDIGALLIKIQERLSSLESKLDTIVARVSPTRTVEVKPSPAPASQPAPAVQPVQAGAQHAGRHENRGRERMMYKIICAECNKDSEIPFKPSTGRPVYCKECFARRKANGHAFKPSADAAPQAAAPAHPAHAEEKPASETKAHVEKKEPAPRKAFAAKKKPAPRKKQPAPKKPKKKGAK